MGTTRVLLLAGTTEAAGFAALLVGRSDVEVVASLAGRTRSPAPMPCRVRSGGLGGVEGLARELGTGGYDVLVDATHPFARAMPHHAAEAAATVGIPRLRLVRPPWRPGPDDDWHAVAGLGAAADALRDLGARRVLLTTGRLELAPFAAVAATRFVVRSIEPPDPMPLVDATVLLARGPFSVDDELALLRGHRIDTIVTRNSGGAATAAKLTAARTLGARVVMVRRPPGPPGPEVATPEAALRWIDALPALPARTSGAAPAGPAQMASEPADGTCTRFDP